MPNIENEGRGHDGTCAFRLIIFDSISVFYVPGRYVYAKGNRYTARDRDVDKRQNCQTYLPVKSKMAVGQL